ncbi:hypothetical protein AB0M54_17145 [Actinoplanes sp. NPDC051470]|uniref:hypothetical protein n=1 Tax=Actinoplanes sp. NPDC051470 TaxID=3157224 RepID=UPI003426AB3B
MRMLRVWLGQVVRSRTLPVVVIFAAVSVFLLWLARGGEAYGSNLALNLGSEFVGTLVVIFALTPIIRRAERGRVREHRHLDFPWYIGRVRAAASSVRILHTFSRLLLPPHDQRFLAAATDLLRRGGTVRIMLMHPDSVAAAQRTVELGGRGDVATESRRNLQTLNEFHLGLDQALRHRCEVRLYSTSASLQVYCWDDRLLASFLPLGRLSGDHSQLEVSEDSPLGGFVTERFEELWDRSMPVDDYWRTRVTIADPGEERSYTARFLLVGDRFYLADPEVVAHIARAGASTVRAVLHHAPERSFQVTVLPDGDDEAAEVQSRYVEKYDHPETVFVRLV